jgi:Flp pilus assembly protein protease CpaA
MPQIYIFLILILILAISTYFDLRYRRVPNRVWYFALPIGITYFYIDIIRNGSYPWQFAGVSIAITVIAVLILFELAQGMFGGADAKAVMLLAVFQPTLIYCIPFAYIVLVAALFGAVFYHFGIARKGLDATAKLPLFPFLLAAYVLLGAWAFG